MLRQANTSGAVLCGAALFVCGIASASAAPVAPATLLPALDVYVDALVAGHAAASCAPAKSPVYDEVAWGKAKAILVASLWAGGFPIDFVRTASQRLDAAAAAAKPNCSDPALAGELGWPDRDGWVEVVEQGLKGMELAVVADPVDPKTWSDIKDLVAKAVPGEKRLLDCVAVSYPETLPAMVHDWAAMLGKTGAALAAAGVPRDELSALLSSADVGQLWHRVAPQGEAELRDSCTKDAAFQASLANFGFGGLGGEIEKLLPAPASDNGGN